MPRTKRKPAKEQLGMGLQRMLDLAYPPARRALHSKYRVFCWWLGNRPHLFPPSRLLFVPNTGPEGRGRCHVLAGNGYASTQFIREHSVHAQANGEPRSCICAMKLIDRIKPSTVRADILPLP